MSMQTAVKPGAAPTRESRPAAVARILTPASLEWVPDNLDPRRSAARLFGDPAQPGPYTVRYRAPAGYEIGLHVHPQDDEQLTVISGTIRYSTGEEGSDAPEHEIAAGGFVLTPAGTPHRLVAITETVLQMSGVGPHAYVYLEKGHAAYTTH